MKELFEQCIQKLDSGNYAEAIPALRDLADRGYADAQYRLGLCYRDGNGVEQNMEQAMIHIFDAAIQNCNEAQFEMGEMHGEKGGLLLCKQEAFLWYRAAARGGPTCAQYEVGNCY